MADQSRKTTDLPLKTTASSGNDAVVFIYGANTSSAQTALIGINNLLANTSGLTIKPANLQFNIISSSPANSASLTIAQGTLFFDTQYVYFATSNNVVKRIALSSF